jgi:hypothetical protein
MLPAAVLLFALSNVAVVVVGVLVAVVVVLLLLVLGVHELRVSKSEKARLAALEKELWWLSGLVTVEALVTVDVVECR